MILFQHLVLVTLLVGLLGVGFLAYQVRRTKRRIQLFMEQEERKDKSAGAKFHESIKKKSVEYSEHDFDALGYDPTSCVTLDHFRPISSQTHCIFARSAKIWGAEEFDLNKSIEENVAASMPALQLFTEISSGLHLDGFAFEIPGDYNANVQSFGQAIRRILTFINPECMGRSYIDKRGWYFEFMDQSFFLTTFCPCYPSSNSRYSFGTSSGFLLMQPEVSFAWKNIGNDTPQTNWDNPETARDKIRVEYKKHGRAYHIPENIYYSPALDVVKPMYSEDPIVEWWKTL